MTGNATLRLAIVRLAQAGITDAARDARLLLAHAMGISVDRLTLHLPDAMTGLASARFEAAIIARLARQPVSQIIGERLFWGHSFKVTRDTLDPRPETEILVAEALRRPFADMLDMGTGTGCILMSCLAAMPMARGVGSDISAAALAVADKNARRLGLQDRLQLIQSDWFSQIDGKFDLIVSNPPYIAADEMVDLSPEVLEWEPHLALSPGGDGLQPYRVIARGAAARLLAGGRLLLEIGPTQAAAVSALLAAHELVGIAILRDLDGRDRVIAAQKPGELPA